MPLIFEIDMKIGYPFKELNPNKRKHFRYSQAQRESAHLLGMDAVNDPISRHNDPIPGASFQVSVDFFPPDRRRRDLDNAFASLKPYFDGIFKALDVDDSKIKYATVTMHDYTDEVEPCTFITLKQYDYQSLYSTEDGRTN
jgi:crossover junction endodeoxyribonuclease RusA